VDVGRGQLVGRRFERFAEMGQDFSDRSGLADERDQPGVAAGFQGVLANCMPVGRPAAGRGIMPLADVPFWRVP
jgi:hypothetical protein